MCSVQAGVKTREQDLITGWIQRATGSYVACVFGAYDPGHMVTMICTERKYGGMVHP